MKIIDFSTDDLTEEERALFNELNGDEPDEDEPKEETHHHGWFLLFVILSLIAAGGAYYWYSARTYIDFEVKESVARNDEERIDYIDFQGNLFSYSLDGASCTDYDDLLLWSESFDMENPVPVQCENYMLLYDKQRSQIVIFDVKGVVIEKTMTLPIVRAAVAANGNFAVLMQEADTGYLQLFNKEGKKLASGEIHMKNTGYAVALAINNAGNKMMLSALNLNDGDIKTTVSFYDFTNTGKKAKNNITANFSYADMVIPEVMFAGDDRAVAFGDNEMIFYTVGAEPKVRGEEFFSQQIKNVFYNDKLIGIITMAAEGEEALDDKLSVYTTGGKKRFETQIGENYTTAEVNANNEIVLSDREHINIYSKYGIHKFAYSSEETIYHMLPWDGATNYYLIKKKETQKVKLR